MRDIGLMRASITLWSLVVAVLSLPVSRTAVADGWNFVIAPYLLVPTITGDASLGRVDNAEVDLSGADIFKSLQLGAMLQGEARHASGYGVLLNYAFMDLGNDFSGPRGYTNVDTDVFQGILEGFATRRFEYSGGVVDGYGGGISASMSMPRHRLVTLATVVTWIGLIPLSARGGCLD